MYRRHFKRGQWVISCLAALALGASPAVAQGGGEGGDAPAMAHATIGTFEGVDVGNGTVVTAVATRDDESIYRTFQVGETTLVEGLGSVMSIGEISPGTRGRVVVVEFVPGAEHPIAQRLQFPTARRIHVTQGAVLDIDVDDRRLTLANAEGVASVELGIGYGATIDSNDGLLALSDLRWGQEVTAYYADPSTAYLLVVTG